MNLKLREAISNDYIDISNLSIEVHNLHLKNRPDVYMDVNNPLLKEYFDDLLNTNNTKLFVVENTDNKELVAYSIIKIMTTQSVPILKPRKFAFIDNFCVKSNYKKNGIGRLLFQYILDYAKTEGASSLQLVVWEFNKDAVKFYESMGMTTRNRKMELNL
ncbi:GNAT family N-acetyltransferase [Anaeromicrobium sediminis]|uniref:GNAT family N-acetyltransferase n=1 Tax=Anaeromicrobium sediminis TaxID=1478221 RepID=A0A267MDD4_9FIRM|nr:GNAT family N-acetyltransferase [Anaeromicrobium sediminis]PAB57392.1 GNAT family N-acetyltransferase [Anaeromicrobium sediminis]